MSADPRCSVEQEGRGDEAKPRSGMVVAIFCNAPEEAMLPEWGDISTELQEEIDRIGGLPCCEGTPVNVGVMGVYCIRCEYCLWQESAMVMTGGREHGVLRRPGCEDPGARR